MEQIGPSQIFATPLVFVQIGGTGPLIPVTDFHKVITKRIAARTFGGWGFGAALFLPAHNTKGGGD